MGKDIIHCENSGQWNKEEEKEKKRMKKRKIT